MYEFTSFFGETNPFNPKYVLDIFMIPLQFHYSFFHEPQFVKP